MVFAPRGTSQNREHKVIVDHLAKEAYPYERSAEIIVGVIALAIVEQVFKVGGAILAAAGLGLGIPLIYIAVELILEYTIPGHLFE